jgi:Flp pilus assembly pilin Flp
VDVTSARPRLFSGFWSHMNSLLVRFVAEECGQDLIEYALLTTFIGLAGALGLDLIKLAINSTYFSWNTGINNLSQPPDPGAGGS